MTDDKPGPRWDERYRRENYLFGTEPNDFLAESADRLPPNGKVLCLADGEGRNGVFLAQSGHHVTSIDSSAVALDKAQALATDRNVALETIAADLFEYDLGESCWEGIVSIFFHMPSAERRRVHGRIVRALRPGGVLILEAYTPKQLEFGTGGPPWEDYLPTAAKLQDELDGLDFLHLLETERDVIEGEGHTGRAAVVQVIARKP